MTRYRVVPTADRFAFTILDRELAADCTLPDPVTLAPVPLEWLTREGAEAWLQRCYRAWEAGTAPAPAGWRPLPDIPSPWE